MYFNHIVFSVQSYSFSFNSDLCMITPVSNTLSCITISEIVSHRDKGVHVTTAWRILWLRMEERLPIWRVAGNILNKHPRKADKGWTSSFGFGRGIDNSSS
jgi:hypothetical protein